MDGGALNHSLEASRGLGLRGAIGGQSRKILVEKFGQILPEFVEVHTTSPQHCGGVAVIGKAEQQVFQGGVFMAAIAGEGERTVQGLFQVSR
jgi:hypothetical protein